jgi:hypothetical protein
MQSLPVLGRESSNAPERARAIAILEFVEKKSSITRG